MENIISDVTLKSYMLLLGAVVKQAIYDYLMYVKKNKVTDVSAFPADRFLFGKAPNGKTYLHNFFKSYYLPDFSGQIRIRVRRLETDTKQYRNYVTLFFEDRKYGL